MNEQSMENPEVQTMAKSEYLIDLENELNGSPSEFMPKIIGQTGMKRQLRQVVKTHLRSGKFAPLLFIAPRGYGKTNIVRGLGKRLHLSTRDTYKPFIERNGASLKSVSAFIQWVGPYLAGPDGGGSEVTIFIDEVHAADVNVRAFLLSCISPLPGTTRCRVTHDGQEFEVDLSMVSFILATTDAQKLTEAFKTRCTPIAFVPYSKVEMAQILNQYIDLCAKREKVARPVFDEQIEADLVSICRETPRFAVNYSEDFVNFCANEGVTEVNRQVFLDFVETNQIHPLGLDNNEMRVLKALHDNGSMSLTALSGVTSLERAMIQRDCEIILHEKNLIIIDGERQITAKGRKVLEGWPKE